MENPRGVPDPSAGGCYRRPPQVAHIYSWSRSGSCDGHHKMVDCEPRIREPAPVRDRGGPREPSRLPLRPEGSAWEKDAAPAPAPVAYGPGALPPAKPGDQT